MEKMIYVDIEPQKPFLTQYTRRLLVDCLKGIKTIKPNEFVKPEDLFTLEPKLNTSLSTIRLYFTIVSYDNSYPVKKTSLVSNDYNDIQVLKDKVKRLEDILMEHHLELEIPWEHHTYLTVGEELHESGKTV